MRLISWIHPSGSEQFADNKELVSVAMVWHDILLAIPSKVHLRQLLMSFLLVTIENIILHSLLP
jgi:hypothetical protein